MEKQLLGKISRINLFAESPDANIFASWNFHSLQSRHFDGNYVAILLVYRVTGCQVPFLRYHLPSAWASPPRIEISCKSCERCCRMRRSRKQRGWRNKFFGQLCSWKHETRLGNKCAITFLLGKAILCNLAGDAF